MRHKYRTYTHVLARLQVLAESEWDEGSGLIIDEIQEAAPVAPRAVPAAEHHNKILGHES